MNIAYYKNTPISYSESGKGNTLVFLHGFLENKSMWNSLIPSFITKYRIVSIDLLGHGDTGCLGYVHTMEDQADAVHVVLQELRIRKAIFIGHSMGGYVSLAFAELYPDTVKGIVLLNSTSRADSEERKLNRDRAIKAVKQNYTNFVRLSIANLFSEDNKTRLAEEIEKTKNEALKTPLQGIIASLEGMKIRKDREVILHFAPYPILLVLGKKDGVLPYEETKEQVEGTSANLITLESGHMSHLECTPELTTSILQFLKAT